MRIELEGDFEVGSFAELESMLHTLAGLLRNGACCDGEPIPVRDPSGLILVRAYQTEPAELIPFPGPRSAEGGPHESPPRAPTRKGDTP